MDVRASLRYLRISPRKVRLVLDLVRGQDLAVALQQLAYLPKRSSVPLMKLLKSAEANAVHNFKLDAATLYIKGAYADEGPKLKRFMPRAMGRATPILKRMSHVTVILGQRNAPGAPSGRNAKAAVKKETSPKAKGTPAKGVQPKPGKSAVVRANTKTPAVKKEHKK